MKFTNENPDPLNQKAMAEALARAFIKETEHKRDSKTSDKFSVEKQVNPLTEKPANMSPDEWVRYILKNNLPPPHRARVFTGRKTGNFPTGVSYWATEKEMAEHYSRGVTTGGIKAKKEDPTVFEAEITAEKTLDMLEIDMNTQWGKAREKLLTIGIEKSELEKWFPELEANNCSYGSITVFDQQLWPNAPKLLNAIRALGYDAIRINEAHEEAYIVLDPNIIRRVADYKVTRN